MNAPQELVRQHLIDPELCIRCGACEQVCTEHAITHDSRNYVVDFARCSGHLECTHVCGTGAVEHWREVPQGQAYTVADQLSWDELPTAPVGMAPVSAGDEHEHPVTVGELPPWSAAHPYVNLYTKHRPAVATIVSNQRVTGIEAASDIHHIVLDFGAQPFPVLEGQSIGVLAPGQDADGRVHHMRAYSVASARDGEHAGSNCIALTVKRITEDYDGKPVRGVCSSYLCDLAVGDSLHVVGPIGDSFLMPNHAAARLLMICTGTGIAPMRGMIEQLLRSQATARPLLFYGGRTPSEMPYCDSLQALTPRLDLNLALSRAPGQPKRYVQDLLRERAGDVVELLKGDGYLYICGLRGMEQGIVEALHDVCATHGLDWEATRARWMAEGRWHVETY